ncbi:hypothetical protein [Nocardia sp. NPDC004722]
MGLGTASAASAEAIPPEVCLWAGAAYQPGSTVYAGGWAFTCHAEGMAHWTSAPDPARRSTVYSPGATRNPQGQFSPGARQPGTDYNDYCVGSQLIEGTDDLYEVVDVRGFLLWRSAGSVTDWRFDAGSPRPQRTWRSASLCIDGVLT